jgi:hypothetical protein
MGSVAMTVTDAPGLKVPADVLTRRKDDAEPRACPIGTIQKSTTESVPRNLPTLVSETCAVIDPPPTIDELLIFKPLKARSVRGEG